MTAISKYSGEERRKPVDGKNPEEMRILEDAKVLLTKGKGSIADALELLDRKGDEREKFRKAMSGLIKAGDVNDAEEFTSEESQWLKAFKTNFDALPGLHPNIEFADVERSLRNDPVTMKKIMAFDANGHFMNVFGEEDGEYVFVSAFTDYNKVSLVHRSLCFDKVGEDLARKNGLNPTGNAVDILNGMGAKPAKGKYHSQLIGVASVNGFAWLETDEATRKAGLACYGDDDGVYRGIADYYDDNGSFRATLRVKKS